jgi:hypothetical protein
MGANSDMAAHSSAVRPDLMALCDQLEQQLSQDDQQRRRLLEAVLAEALREPKRALASEGLTGPCSNASASRDSSRFATPR